MIVGYGNAQAVVGRQAHRFANEISVVDDVVVRQRRALRRAGGSRGELDVDRIVELKLGFEGHEPNPFIRRSRSDDLVEVEHSPRLVDPQADDDFELWQSL